MHTKLRKYFPYISETRIDDLLGSKDKLKVATELFKSIETLCSEQSESFTANLFLKMSEMKTDAEPFSDYKGANDFKSQLSTLKVAVDNVEFDTNSDLAKWCAGATQESANNIYSKYAPLKTWLSQMLSDDISYFEGLAKILKGETNLVRQSELQLEQLLEGLIKSKHLGNDLQKPRLSSDFTFDFDGPGTGKDKPGQEVTARRLICLAKAFYGITVTTDTLRKRIAATRSNETI